MAGDTRLGVVVVDGTDTMMHAWDLIERSGAAVVAVRDGTGDVPRWTVWRSQDLLTLPRSLHESGLRHVGALLSLAQRRGIETWPEGDSPPPGLPVLVVADGIPVALVLSDRDPDGAAVFETHIDLPPDLPTESAPPVPPDGSAGDDDEDLPAEASDDGASDGDWEDVASDSTGAGDAAGAVEPEPTATEPREDAADDSTDEAAPGGWWTRDPAEPTGPVRGGGDWATASPVRPPSTPPTPPRAARPPAATSRPPTTALPPPPSPQPPNPQPPGTPSGSHPQPRPGARPSVAPPPPAATGVPPDSDRDEATTTRLHPFLDAPDRVDSGASITVTIGVGAEAQPGLTTSGDGMEVAVDDAGEVAFEVMVLAQGFTVHGARSELRVAAAAPDKKRLTITLDADEVTTVTRTLIEVQYGQAGTPIGRAWREVVIAPADADGHGRGRIGGPARHGRWPGGSRPDRHRGGRPGRRDDGLDVLLAP